MRWTIVLIFQLVLGTKIVQMMAETMTDKHYHMLSRGTRDDVGLPRVENAAHFLEVRV